MFNNGKKIIMEKIKEYKFYIIASIVLVAAGFFFYEYFNRYFHIFRSPEQVKKYVLSFGKYTVFTFIILQILQVIVFFIPGEIIQITGGYLFGAAYGSIISLLGITIGSALAFMTARILGSAFVRKIVSTKERSFFGGRLKGENFKYVVFLLYLIPGIPKDVLAYICGISRISFKEFICYSTLGRIPGIIISAYFGAKIESRDSAAIITIAVTMSALFLIGVFKGDKIFKAIERRGRRKRRG